VQAAGFLRKKIPTACGGIVAADFIRHANFQILARSGPMPLFCHWAWRLKTAATIQRTKG
jgi:hypothetical protein